MSLLITSLSSITEYNVCVDCFLVGLFHRLKKKDYSYKWVGMKCIECTRAPRSVGTLHTLLNWWQVASLQKALLRRVTLILGQLICPLCCFSECCRNCCLDVFISACHFYLSGLLFWCWSFKPRLRPSPVSLYHSFTILAFRPRLSRAAPRDLRKADYRWTEAQPLWIIMVLYSL